jgi:ABC-2 type transport system permease protein
MLMSVSFAVLLAYVFYETNIFNLGFYLIPFMINLLLTGWAVGLLVSGLIVLFGMRVQTLAWTGIYILAPFSGVYYPISTLPMWAQNISQFLPTSYVFEGMRSVILQGTMSTEMLLKSSALNLIFIIFGVTFFVFMFNKSKERGLARLE